MSIIALNVKMEAIIPTVFLLLFSIFLLFVVVFRGSVSWIPDWPVTHYVVKDDLKLQDFLPPQAWAIMIGSWRARDWTQGFTHAKQALYQLSYIFSIFYMLVQLSNKG